MKMAKKSKIWKTKNTNANVSQLE